MTDSNLKNTLEQWLEQLPVTPQGFSSDSRSFQIKSPTNPRVFVAMQGEKTHGHEFVGAVISEGAIGAVVGPEFSTTFQNIFQKFSARILIVDNPHRAHRILSQIFRERFKGILIGVGGSSGKTSTKEFLYQILSTKFRVFKTQKSQNGELGIPRTLEQLSEHFEMGIVEIGIDAPGDMIRHASLVKPDIAILTSIGEEHLNQLKDIETVYREEKILFDIVLKSNGHCFAPAKDTYLSRLKGSHPLMHLISEETLAFKFSQAHPYARQNATLAAAVALHVGMKHVDVQAALQNLELPEGRGRDIQLKSGTRILADHYNANPSSMKAGLSHALNVALTEQKPLVLILGDMLDLGTESERFHYEMLPEIQRCKAHTIVLVGSELKRLTPLLKTQSSMLLHFDNSELAAQKIKSYTPQSPCIILVKGSRGIGLEKILEKFMQTDDR